MSKKPVMTPEEQAAEADRAAERKAVEGQLAELRQNRITVFSFVTSEGVEAQSGGIEWQVGPVSDRNGMLFDEVIQGLIGRIDYLQEFLPCEENEHIRRHLVDIIGLVNVRLARRAAQGITGSYQEHLTGGDVNPALLGAMTPEALGLTTEDAANVGGI